VRLRLDQEAVLAREPFRATLEFENGESARLTGLAIQLTVSDASGNDVTGLFGIPVPELSNLTNITGLGVLSSGNSASVAWTIIPTSDAAPKAPVRYVVSGLLAYTLNGIPITVPLAPAGITVHPTARLDVKYFHERDV